MWTHRILLEATQWSQNAFVTLTYDQKNLRSSSGLLIPQDGMTDLLPSLQPKELQDWLKRLRKAIEPQRIRYYAVGEYGDESQRPHYHAALFNFPSCSNGRTGRLDRRCCNACELVRTTWGHGNVLLGSLETHSAQYVAGYVTKKMTSVDDPRLLGRYPEFCRMSRRPGLGVSMMHELASELMKLGLDTSEADVPSALRHGGRKLPLGRHLRRVLRQLIGKDANAPEGTVRAAQEELQAVLDAAGLSTSLTRLPGDAKKMAITNALIDAGSQRVLQMEARARIFKRGRPL